MNDPITESQLDAPCKCGHRCGVHGYRCCGAAHCRCAGFEPELVDPSHGGQLVRTQITPDHPVEETWMPDGFLNPDAVFQETQYPDPKLTAWIEDAVRTKMLAEGWIDPETCEHPDWKPETFGVLVVTHWHPESGETTRETREQLKCVACGATKAGDLVER